jgi:predicted AlkP superfamily phosphohydrolase/phosphomutase
MKGWQVGERQMKVLCIGLDGATFDLIKPWISKGKLPNLRKLMEEGVHADMTSVIPPLSPQAWSSFMTGVNPGKHGVFGFKRQVNGKYEYEFTNSRSIRVKTLWGLLGELGKRVVVVNVPMTYPPEKVNGIMVSGPGTPGTGCDFTFPAEFKTELFQLAKDYRIHLHVWGSLDQPNKREDALNALLKMTETRASLCTALMQKYPWEFFSVVFSSVDQVQHHFWKYLGDNGRDVKNDDRFRDAILRVYEKNDEVIGSLLKHIDEDTTVLVMSDHGAGGSSGTKIHIDEILKREKLFASAGSTGKKLSDVPFRLKRWSLRLLGEGKRALTKRLSSETKDAVLKLLPGVQGKLATVSKLSGVDWSGTKVYPGENVDFLRVNLRGKLPCGVVNPGSDYEDTVNLTIRRLEGLRHPDNGERLIEKVFRKEHLYHGPYTDEGPDLVIWTKDYKHAIGADLTKNNHGRIVSSATGESDPSGTHRLNGILIARGSHIKAGQQIASAHIQDLFPTILHIMGCSVPAYSDGKVLSEIFVEGHSRSNPVSYAEMSMDRAAPVSGQSVYSDVENKEIEQQLKDLGYFE